MTRPYNPTPYVMWMGKAQYEDLWLTFDPYGIYRSRKALAKLFPGIAIYRGHEWWHA